MLQSKSSFENNAHVPLDPRIRIEEKTGKQKRKETKANIAN